MYVHLMSVDKHIWVGSTDEPFISKNEVDDYIKFPKDWTDNEIKKSSYNLNVINIPIFELSVNIYYTLSHIIRVHKYVERSSSPLQRNLEKIFSNIDRDNNIKVYVQRMTIKNFMAIKKSNDSCHCP